MKAGVVLIWKLMFSSVRFPFTTNLKTFLQDLLVEIDDSADDFMNNSKELSAMEKTRRIGEISKQFTKCKEYGDDKVSLAMQVWAFRLRNMKCGLLML